MINELQKFINKAVEREDLTTEEATRAMHIMLTGGATPAQIAAYLVALRMKGETVAELTGSALTLRSKCTPFPAPASAVDTAGTGGDHSGSVNVSTAVAIVTAACGVPVVKHGNRSVSSRSGSADVLEALSVKLNAAPEQMQQALAECNLAFLMTPLYHKSMRQITPIRQELKIRTLFNLLGPLVNPAQVKRQLMGVFSRELLLPIAEVHRALGTEHAWIVWGAEGLDEISISGVTYCAELKNGNITEFTLTPADAGLPNHPLEALKGGNAEYNARAMERLLAGEKGAYRDAVLFNTAATLIIAGHTQTLPEGVAKAATAIDTGAARQVLDDLVRITRLPLA
jgi:anthranilate phosphoribosyltransferase